MVYSEVSAPVRSVLRMLFRLRMLFAELRSAVSGGSERERIFNGIIASNRRLIASICLSFASTREDFEDLCQDTYLNIWRGCGEFRSESLVSTWVYRVTFNTCVSYFRKSRPTAKQVEAFRAFYEELYDTASADELERYEKMYRLIGLLKPEEKAVLEMWLDGRKYEEIASVTGISRDAVATRLKRIKERLVSMNN